MAVITLPSSGRAGSFLLEQEQSAQVTSTGLTQITSFPRRLWTMSLEIPPLRDNSADLRKWVLALTQLSNLNNVFAFTPPHYTGPSTGYSGSAPQVAGASQLGTSLNVDGLAVSSNILLAGDFFSFDVTSAGGNTNRQLIPVNADVTSDGTGAATFNFDIPIRQAPADNAAVEIFSPTAFFRLVDPAGGLQALRLLFGEFSLEAIERVSP